MIASRTVLLCLALAWQGQAQTYTRQNIATIFGFENNTQRLALAHLSTARPCRSARSG
jgi:hypothetical protein